MDNESAKFTLRITETHPSKILLSRGGQNIAMAEEDGRFVVKDILAFSVVNDVIQVKILWVDGSSTWEPTTSEIEQLAVFEERSMELIGKSSHNLKEAIQIGLKHSSDSNDSGLWNMSFRIM
jgi:hypothetical protein